MNILVVDDERIILDLVVRILEKGNHKAITVDSGKNSISIFEQNKENIDLVILDHNLPDISGIEVLEKIRKIKPNIPCLYSSGEVNIKGKIPDELKINTYFLVKPYQALSMLDLVTQIDHKKIKK
ncbi:MAG: response regulator [candidate division Zixibacteria bacterium]|nr:response regulator [candidate division Zixibacteria bacterium]